MRLVVIIVFFKEAWTEKIGTVYMFMSEAEVICWVLNAGAPHWVDKSTFLYLIVGLLNTKLEALDNINTAWPRSSFTKLETDS